MGLGRAVRASAGDIEQAMFVRVHDELSDPSACEDEEYVTGLRCTVAALLDYAITGIERGSADVPVPDHVMMQARRAVRAGVGLDTVLRRYVAGYALLRDYVIVQAQRERCETAPRALRDVLETQALLLDRLIAPVTGAYLLERETIASPPPVAVTVTDGDRAGAMRRRAPGLGLGLGLVDGWGPRERILRAAVQVVAERGFKDATVGEVLARARVSWHTFQGLFETGLDGCVIAALDGALRHGGMLVERAFAAQRDGRDGFRATLAGTLDFMDEEPALARVVMVEALAGGPVVLAHRERVAGEFCELVFARVRDQASWRWPLDGQALFAAVLGVIHGHLVARDPRPLIELLPALMASLLAPVLDPRELQEEIARSTQLARTLQAGRVPHVSAHADWAGITIPAVLSDRRSRHARRCLAHLAKHPGVSNRQVASALGVAHTSQVSGLLARLHAQGLLAKRSHGAGRRNAWSLTEYGHETLDMLEQTDRET